MKSLEAHVLPSSEYFIYTPSSNTRDFLLHPLICGIYHYEGGYDLVRQSYDSFLLEVILEGQVTIETEGKTLLAQQNNVVLIDCYGHHRYYSDIGWKAVWIHFDGASARGYYNLITKTNGNVLSTHHSPYIQKKIMNIYKLLKSGEAINESQVAFQLASALTAMTDPIKASYGLSNGKDSIERLLTKINADISNPPSVQEMAKIAGLSQYHFIRVFNNVVGMTPKQYIMVVRMNRAKYLLNTTDIEIRDIAKMIGYSSESAFCTGFRNALNITPGDYRNTSRQAIETPSHGFPAHWK